jgi:hypothetical protein
MNYRQKPDLRTHPAEFLYHNMQHWAEGAKVFLKMVLGLAAVIIVVVIVAEDVAHGKTAGSIEKQVLVIIAAALAGAASLELAYTLFTPSADELIDPLMLAISSALLFLVSSQSQLTWQGGVAIVLFTGALAGMFKVRSVFIGSQRPEGDDLVDQAREPESATDGKAPHRV